MIVRQRLIERFVSTPDKSISSPQFVQTFVVGAQDAVDARQVIRTQVEAIYRSGKFWPEPLIGVNPHFEDGRALVDLANEGVVDPDLPKVFAVGADRSVISLRRHQDQSLSKALQGRNFIVTTGTRSGKSLCFFVPIVDRILKAKRAGAAPRTRAIVIYPMNALANSQREELEKFIEGCGIDPHLKPTFERYTGQESDAERKRIAAAKPDIILTNFMMLELLMTRQDGLDQEVVASMEGLEWRRFEQGEALVRAALVATHAGMRLVDDNQFRAGLGKAGAAAIGLDVVEADNGEGRPPNPLTRRFSHCYRSSARRRSC